MWKYNLVNKQKSILRINNLNNFGMEVGTTRDETAKLDKGLDLLIVFLEIGYRHFYSPLAAN